MHKHNIAETEVATGLLSLAFIYQLPPVQAINTTNNQLTRTETNNRTVGYKTHVPTGNRNMITIIKT